MIITNSLMMKRMERALRTGDSLYTLDDIDKELASGDMQGHVEGNTWAITKVQQFPRRKAVHIMFVVGNLSDSFALENKIHNWADSIGADLLTAVGREGWWGFRTPGWRITGQFYSKDIRS